MRRMKYATPPDPKVKPWNKNNPQISTSATADTDIQNTRGCLIDGLGSDISAREAEWLSTKRVPLMISSHASI